MGHPQRHLLGPGLDESERKLVRKRQRSPGEPIRNQQASSPGGTDDLPYRLCFRM